MKDWSKNLRGGYIYSARAVRLVDGLGVKESLTADILAIDIVLRLIYIHDIGNFGQ